MTTEYQRSVPVGRLTDRVVLDYTGHKIGDLDEIVLDMSTGCLDFGVVSFGGFLGIGEKHHLIPAAALHYDPEQGGFRMDVTREQVEKAPGFTGSSRPDFSDEAYMQSVFSYWGAERKPVEWQRPWDPDWRQQHPEMYGQAGTTAPPPPTEQQTGMYGENTTTGQYEGTGTTTEPGPHTAVSTGPTEDPYVDPNQPKV